MDSFSTYLNANLRTELSLKMSVQVGILLYPFSQTSDQICGSVLFMGHHLREVL